MFCLPKIFYGSGTYPVMFFKVHIETASHAIFRGHPPNFPVKSDEEKNNSWNQSSLNYDLLKKPNRRCNFANFIMMIYTE